ncbi:MAG: exodeoxyribonuclease VII small subunit [Prevotellaceae bacterium]|jgi:exodeoxyribonuclease VII small subunit|nr:exodeoxyribonuclease VII small subunit [Prevotellaceae bacterium]
MQKNEPSYAEAIAEVEKILAHLESGVMDVDGMSAAVKRAADLLQLCRKKLHDTEQSVKKAMGEKDEQNE